MSSEAEIIYKKRKVEELGLVGLAVQEIATTLNISRRTVSKLKKQIYKERLQQHEDKPKLIDEILINYKRLLEAAWYNYYKSENKLIALRVIKEILSDRFDKLFKLGFIQPASQEIRNEDATMVDETTLICLLSKLGEKENSLAQSSSANGESPSTRQRG